MVRAIILFVVTSVLCVVTSVFAPTRSMAQEDKLLFHEAVGVHKPTLSCARHLSDKCTHLGDNRPHEKHAGEALQDVPLKTLLNDVDVLSYDVYIDLYDGLIPLDTNAQTPETFNATVDIRLVMLSDTLAGVPLHTDVFTIEVLSAQINGSSTSMRRSKGRQIFTPPFAIRRGDTLALHIEYKVSRVGGGGLVVVNGRERWLENASYPIAFTFSEPENSRRWFPCNDVPHDKAFFRASARIPLNNRLVSNGELVRTTLDGDTAKIEVWSSPDVMPPYLFTMNASQFTQLYQLYSRADGTGVPIRNFQWDTDLDGFFNAPYAVRNVPEMFAAFEPKFGRYPFTTYGHVAVHPVGIGGMEHQTMSTVNRRWLEGNAEVGYAHELGHQWMGDAVTCATWGDIWLNEGGATFSEAIWREHQEGFAGYRDQMMRRRSKYMEQGQDAPPVWDIPIGNLFNEATTYAKSAWIFHMMRRMLGDEQFFAKLQLLLTSYRGTSIQTSQFEDFWKQQVPNPLVSWDVFFDQWLVKKGHPYFWVRLESVKDNSNLLRVVVDQIQVKDGVPDVFQALVGMRFYSNGVVVGEHEFVMKERSASFTIDGTRTIDSIEFDPTMLTLHQLKTDVAVGVDGEAHNTLTPKCSECPTLRVVGANPISADEDVVLGVGNAPEHSVVTVVDVRGQLAWSEKISSQQNVVRIANTRLSSGAYVAILTSRWGTTTTRFVIR